LSTVSATSPYHQPGVNTLSDLVETYSGHRLHDRPLRFRLAGSWHTVVHILARWQEPELLGFTVLAEDGRKYSLEYIKEEDIWKVDIFRPARPVP
jgi:hypothetical protein